MFQACLPNLRPVAVDHLPSSTVGVVSITNNDHNEDWELGDAIPIVLDDTEDRDDDTDDDTASPDDDPSG